MIPTLIAIAIAIATVALVICDLWGDALPDWIVCDVSDDD